MNYPPPIKLGEHLGQIDVGWPDQPYYVQVSVYDTIYLNVQGKPGYRQLSSGRRGFIASSTNPSRIDRTMRRYLKIAWRLSQKHPARTETRAIANTVLGDLGIEV